MPALRVSHLEPVNVAVVERKQRSNQHRIVELPIGSAFGTGLGDHPRRDIFSIHLNGFGDRENSLRIFPLTGAWAISVLTFAEVSRSPSSASAAAVCAAVQNLHPLPWDTTVAISSRSPSDNVDSPAKQQLG